MFTEVVELLVTKAIQLSDLALSEIRGISWVVIDLFVVVLGEDRVYAPLK